MASFVKHLDRAALDLADVSVTLPVGLLFAGALALALCWLLLF